MIRKFVVTPGEEGPEFIEVDDTSFVVFVDEDDCPPKPEEPTGLGAVVLDAEGGRWVRTNPEQPAWTEWDRPVNRYTYDAINAVCVLSEGWSE